MGQRMEPDAQTVVETQLTTDHVHVSFQPLKLLKLSSSSNHLAK